MDNLPPELIEHIASFLPKGKIRLLHTTISISIPNPVKIAKKRIALTLLLKTHMFLLFSRIAEILLSHEYFLFNCQNTTLMLNGVCLLYGPENQRSYACRFCGKNRRHHRYIGLMNLYRKLVCKQEPIHF